MIDEEKLLEVCGREGIELDKTMLLRFSTYADFLVEYNRSVNLTAITEPDEIIIRHFLDSLLLLRAYSLPHGASIIDIGTGAGFPGTPVKIVRGDIRLTLLDSLKKRIVFLQLLAEKLELEYTALHCRAEDGAREQDMREQFDMAVSRAVAALPILCEYCLPYVRLGGVFAAMKSRGVTEEIKAAERAIKELGGELSDVKEFHLPDSSIRNILIVKKISQTPSKYPRGAAKMTKKPL